MVCCSEMQQVSIPGIFKSFCIVNMLPFTSAGLSTSFCIMRGEDKELERLQCFPPSPHPSVSARNPDRICGANERRMRPVCYFGPGVNGRGGGRVALMATTGSDCLRWRRPPDCIGPLFRRSGRPRIRFPPWRWMSWLQEWWINYFICEMYFFFL